MFDLLVIVYLFLGGCGGGLLLIAALWSLLFHGNKNRTSEETDAFENLKRACFIGGFLILCLAAGCLLADLGKPERFFLLFTRPTISILTFGSFILAASILIVAFLAVINVLRFPRFPVVGKKVAEGLCVVSSLLLIAYTGVYLWNVKAVVLWDSLTVPVLFVLSSLSAGLALIFLVAPFVQGNECVKERLFSLHVSHLVLLVLELVVLGLFLWEMSNNVFAAPSLQLLFEADLKAWFFIGLVGLGLILPLVGELAVVVQQKVYRLLPIDLLCLLGGFCLRYCLVLAGLH